MFCTKCGEAIQVGANFCGGCGERLGITPKHSDTLAQKALDPDVTTQTTLATILAEQFTKRGPLSPIDSAGLIIRIAKIVSEAHARPTPFIYGDLCPENVIITNYNDLEVLRAVKSDLVFSLADCAIKENNRNRLIQRLSNLDLSPYVSPQINDGESPDKSDDICSIGVIWYELLTGISIFGNCQGDRFKRKLGERGLNDMQVAIVSDCLNSNENQRIKDSNILIESLLKLFEIKSTINYSDMLRHRLENCSSDELNNIASLTPLAAAQLAKWEGSNLFLNGLTDLNPDTAAQLATWKGSSLYLKGLSNLNPETAAQLATWKGTSLELNGLTNLNPETATQLATWKGEWLDFSGLTSLNPETTAQLATWKGNWLYLDGLTDLNPETASQLVTWNGKRLYLGRLTDLNPETASQLVTWNGKQIYFNSLSHDSKLLLKQLRTSSLNKVKPSDPPVLIKENIPIQPKIIELSTNDKPIPVPPQSNNKLGYTFCPDCSARVYDYTKCSCQNKSGGIPGVRKFRKNEPSPWRENAVRHMEDNL